MLRSDAGHLNKQVRFMQDIKVLYEDNHLLAIDKPAGLATMGGSGRDESAAALVKEYLKRKYAKPGNVYLGIVSRLDAPVSGVVLFARTSKAAARLAEQFRSRSTHKIYTAVVSGNIEPAEGALTDWVRKDDAGRRMVIAESRHPEAKEALLKYRRLRTAAGMSLVEIELITGRKHQIRLQLAHRGYPVVGDKKYGSPAALPPARFGPAIALCATRLTVIHPTRHEALVLEAEVPPGWPLRDARAD